MACIEGAKLVTKFVIHRFCFMKNYSTGLYRFVDHKFTTCRYTPSERAEMGRYTSLHGVAAAARFLTGKFDHQVSETTLHSMKKAYLQEVTRKRANEDNENIDLLPHQK